MATYTGSPFGTISGKLGHVIGSKWKGIRVITKYHSCAPHIGISPTAVKNIFRILGKLGSRHFDKLTNHIWNALATRSKLPVTGFNLLIKKSSRILFKSTVKGLQDPDITLLQVSDGNLEPSQCLIGASYTAATGQLVVTWATDVYRNGQHSDNAVILLYRSKYAGHPEGNSYLLGANATRSAGTSTVFTAPNLPPEDLTCFLYFYDGTGNYSPSTDRGRAIMQARDAIHHWESAKLTSSSNYVKVHSFKIYREQNYRAYKLFCRCKNATLYFKLKSGIEGDLDSDAVSGVAADITVRVPVLSVTAQNEYITVEVYTKNLGSGQARLESGYFYGYIA